MATCSSSQGSEPTSKATSGPTRNMCLTRRFGENPPVRTTIAAAGVPGKSLVEIDVIAYI